MLDSILERLQERDDNTTRIVTSYSDLRFQAEPTKKYLYVADNEYTLTDEGYKTLLNEVNVPVGYANRMPVTLLEDNVNFWLRQRSDQQFAALTNGDRIRTFMNPGYEYVPTVEVFRAVAEKMGTEWDLRNTEISDTVVKVAFTTGLESGGNVGDVSAAGLSLVHSDAWVVAPRFDSYMLRLVCTNGMTTPVTGRKFRVSGSDRESILEQVGQFTDIAVDNLASMIQGYERLRDQTVQNVSRLIDRICKENRLPSKVREVLILTQTSQGFLSTMNSSTLDSMHDVVNLLTWVATHNSEINESHRQHLREIAGNISTTGNTRCDSCGSAVE